MGKKHNMLQSQKQGQEKLLLGSADRFLINYRAKIPPHSISLN